MTKQDFYKARPGVYESSQMEYTARASLLQYGPKVERVGTDEEELFRWCLAAANNIAQQAQLKFKK